MEHGLTSLGEEREVSSSLSPVNTVLRVERTNLQIQRIHLATDAKELAVSKFDCLETMVLFVALMDTRLILEPEMLFVSNMYKLILIIH